MKQLLPLAMLALIISSCGKNEPFYGENQFYKGIDSGNGIEPYLTFLNDTIVAFNSGSLKPCGWNFNSLSKLKDGLYMSDEHRIDTVFWLIIKEKYLILKLPKSELIYEKVDFPESKKDSLKRQIEITKGFSDKGIIFSCDYSLKEVAYYYDKAVQEVKNNLENPGSARFIKAYIHEDWIKDSVTVVDFDVETKNEIGLFTEDKYYIFFIPTKPDSTKFDIKFSKSSILP